MALPPLARNKLWSFVWNDKAVGGGTERNAEMRAKVSLLLTFERSGCRRCVCVQIVRADDVHREGAV